MRMPQIVMEFGGTVQPWNEGNILTSDFHFKHMESLRDDFLPLLKKIRDQSVGSRRVSNK